MDDTTGELDDRVPDTAEEPVLVWAIGEDILLANDAALLLLAQSEEDLRSPVGPPATLARTLARVVTEGGPCRRPGISVRTTSAGAAGSPTAAPPAGKTGPDLRGRASLAGLLLRLRVALARVLG